ncbi:sensor histidine kinase [Halalkalibacterium halodurans]|uniref:sensor histidine kinase n=1 Tax=Halalkalibacterium halodurans TaxID=86665 RepID=UPI002AA97C74|nr:histidine kinase [Halalkalibacterium halodurans]MDY7223290.1 histidine kinase [Halalkalibacterium halodurans]MDY7242511.1 histidine kinase [Halalkalibacterium halodurans]
MNKRGLWHYISSYKFNSVFIRNLFLILILTIIPVMILSYVVYYHMNQAVEEEVAASSQSSLIRTADIVDSLIKDSNRLAAQLSLQEDVQMFFLLSSYMSGMRAERIENLIKMYSDTFNYIDSIYIYSEMNRSMITRQYYGHVDLFQENTWYEHYEKMDENRMFIQPRKFNDRFPYYLSLYYPVYLDNKYKLGVVVINMNIQGLRNFIGQTNHDVFNDLYIIDNVEQTIIYNEDLEKLEMKFEEVFTDIPLPPFGHSTVQEIEEEPFILSISELDSQDWSIISFQPLTTYNQKMQDIWTFLVIFLGISLLLAISISFVITVRTYRPIEKIMIALQDPDKWKEGKKKFQQNELYYINTSIVDHMESKQQLEEELDQRLKHLNEAQTLALQAQVNPHFISNTLEAMKWKAMHLTGGENDISTMALSLSRLLRLTLGTKSQVIPIRLEIELNKRYLEIMETRFKDTIFVLWDVDDSLLDYEIVQLTLQPLIENAIHHGIRPKNKQGTIVVRIKDKGSTIYFEVSDDGVGMAEVNVQKLYDQLEQMFSVEGRHVGLRNVNQRIKLIFGDTYGLTISSKVNEGTTVFGNIPKYKSSQRTDVSSSIG